MGTGTVMSKDVLIEGARDIMEKDFGIIDREDGLIDGNPGFIEQDFGV